MKMTLRTTMRGLGEAAFFFALILSLALAPKAQAHARMVKSIPARDATLSKTPEQLDLWFNELLEEGFNTVEVFTAGELKSQKHTNRAKGKPSLDPRDHTHLIVKLEALAPGDYVVEWRVLSRDGHSAPGRIMFHVGEAK